MKGKEKGPESFWIRGPWGLFRCYPIELQVAATVPKAGYQAVRFDPRLALAVVT